MPLPISRTGRHSFAGTATASASRSYGPRARTTSRGMNDAVLRAGAPQQVRPRGAAASQSVGSLVLNLAFLTASADFGQGVIEGLTDSLKSAWSLVSHDMWQARTYSELATTITALGMITAPNLLRGLAAAQALDNICGTHVARRQLEILQAISQLAQELPRWTARQWGHAVGTLVGNVLLAKGAGVGIGLVRTELTHLQTITASLKKLGALSEGAGMVAKARATIPVYSHFTRVRIAIPFLDVRTMPNSSAFWSGLDGGAAEAKNLAILNRRTSLELTPGGTWLERQSVLLDKKVDWFGQMRPQWARLSKRFAGQAQGSIEVFKGPKFDPVRSIWITEEKGVLEKSLQSGKVTEIIIHELP